MKNPTVKECCTNLHSWVREHAPQTHLKSGIDTYDINLLQKKLSLKLPGAFSDYLKNLGGQAITGTALINDHKLLDTSAIFIEWCILRAKQGVKLYDACGEALDIRADKGVKAKWFNASWIPIAGNGFSAYYCMDLDPGTGGKSGQIISFDTRNPERKLEAKSMADWLSKLLEGLKDGSIRPEPEEEKNPYPEALSLYNESEEEKYTAEQQIGFLEKAAGTLPSIHEDVQASTYWSLICGRMTELCQEADPAKAYAWHQRWFESRNNRPTAPYNEMSAALALKSGDMENARRHALFLHFFRKYNYGYNEKNFEEDHKEFYDLISDILSEARDPFQEKEDAYQEKIWLTFFDDLCKDVRELYDRGEIKERVFGIWLSWHGTSFDGAILKAAAEEEIDFIGENIENGKEEEMLQEGKIVVYKWKKGKSAKDCKPYRDERSWNVLMYHVSKLESFAKIPTLPKVVIGQTGSGVAGLYKTLKGNPSVEIETEAAPEPVRADYAKLKKTELYTRIEKWWTDHQKRTGNKYPAGATIDELYYLEKDLKLVLPDALKIALLIHNGSDENELTDGFDLLSVESIRLEYNVWNDLDKNDPFESSFVVADKRVKKKWWNKKWIPFSGNGSGDNYCIDMDPTSSGKPGQIVTLWHEDGSRDVIADDFLQWLEKSLK